MRLKFPGISAKQLVFSSLLDVTNVTENYLFFVCNLKTFYYNFVEK